MTDRETWLGLTTEAAIEPGLLICDPHHHLWDYPGSRYLVDEFAADIGGGHQVVKTVFVECRQFYLSDGPVELRPVGETLFVDSVAGPAQTTCGVCDVAAGIVGFADLSLGSPVQGVLDAHMEASTRFRGVRHASAWHESERIHNAHTNPPRHLLGERLFREGLACLEERGLSFDAWLYHPQIPELTDLARAFPALSIVLNHIAGPLGIGPYSGQREEVFRTVPAGSIELAEVMGPYYRACIEQFGADRCMFESNFPVDRASCSYTVQWNAFKRLTVAYSKAERAALFHNTASRIYRLGGK